jgi:hypothetical protein
MASNDIYKRFPRLKGSENWEPWAIRTKATLIKEKLTSAMVPMQEAPIKPISQDPPTNQDKKAKMEYEEQLRQYEQYVEGYKEKSYEAASCIRLELEEGPLLQTQYIEEARDLWIALEGLYKPSGFTSEFLLANQLFSTTLASSNYKMEEYLTKIKRLTDQLASRNLAIPTGIIAAYTLSKLSNEYQSIVAVITQTYRQGGGSENINLTNLFGQLIDEEKRVKSRNVDTEMAMPAQAQKCNHGGQCSHSSDRPTCSHCGYKGHIAENCYFLHPEKRPKDKKGKKGKKDNKKENEGANIAQDDEETASEFAGFAATSGSQSWILDSGATSHICGQREKF